LRAVRSEREAVGAMAPPWPTFGSNAKFKVGFCQTSVSKDKAVSLATAREAVAKAAAQGAQLVILGEMFACPYATKSFREYGERVPGLPESVTAFLAKLRAAPAEVRFEETLACIEGAYSYRAVPFTNGAASNKAGENAGSAKVLSFAKLAGLSEQESLLLFGQHYRDTMAAPDGTSHGNIRAFMKTGWAGVAFPEGLALAPIPTIGDESPTVQFLQTAAMEHKIWLIGGSFPELEHTLVYNTCLVFNPDGAIVARHRKAHLFDIDVAATASRPAMKFRESDVLSAGEQVTLVDLPWCRAGVGICYDIRFPEYAMACRQRGAKFIVYPGAFNMTTGPAHWSLLVRGRATDTQCFVSMVSPARSTDKEDYQAYGHSMVAGPFGEVLAEAEHGDGVFVVDIDPSEADRIRNQIPTSFQKREDLYVPYADEEVGGVKRQRRA